MAPSVSSLTEDIEFIFGECKRFMEMDFEELRSLPQLEHFYELPHPSGSGHMLCGQAAANRVSKLANEAGRRANLTLRVAHETLCKPTKELLVKRFIVEGREVNQQQIDRFLAAAGKRARAACSDVTHLIPCTLMTTQEPSRLKIGPVTFLNRGSFRQLLLNKVENFGSELPHGWRREHSRKLLSDAVKFFRQFDWVAQIRVRGCDAKTSELIAERTVTSALDCLHLIFRAQNSSKMRVGGPALRTDRRGGIIIDPDGKLFPSKSVSWAAQVNFPDGWSEQLEHSSVVNLMNLCGTALEAAVDPDLTRPISRRFLDAAQWFGEACRDDRAATKIVKYVIALERMTMTEEKDDIGNVMAERVAALCGGSENQSFEKCFNDVKAIYDLRSRLVHGSISPADPRIGKGLSLAAHIAEECLVNALTALDEPALRINRISNKKLASWYNEGVRATQNDKQPPAGDQPV